MKYTPQASEGLSPSLPVQHYLTPQRERGWGALGLHLHLRALPVPSSASDPAPLLRLCGIRRLSTGPPFLFLALLGSILRSGLHSSWGFGSQICIQPLDLGLPSALSPSSHDNSASRLGLLEDEMR